MKILVIVESPSKCKKIKDFLNDIDDFNIYDVVSTMGHITELRSLNSIDMVDNFRTTYDIIEKKKKTIDIIRKKINAVDEVVLGCDNDREGESINYYVCSVFNLSLSTKRIVFNEITRTAIEQAIKNPITINMNVVNAQKARQIIDMLVGFKISPMLWKYISRSTENSLSAGRCQSPALKLVYENQKECDNRVETNVYKSVGYFTNKTIDFELNAEFGTIDELKVFLNGSIDFNHEYTCSKPIKVVKNQPKPFTTSRLQQAASNEFGFSPKETMKICQTLYETGFITYMRTDSNLYSKEFITQAKKYIATTYSASYVSSVIDSLCIDIVELKQKEAHEAIRPTDVSLCELSNEMNFKEKRLYKLVWNNTIESCMQPAKYNSVTANITGFGNTTFTYKSENIDFLGWKIVKNNAKNDKYFLYLQNIKNPSIINLIKITSQQIIKDKKLHYSEAKLVQLLEEQGIGRPSTFATLIEKIQERDYVKKMDITSKKIDCVDVELFDNKIVETQTTREIGGEKNKLIIQPLGIIVIEFLQEHFNNIVDYEYTKRMENELDMIADGTKDIVGLCDECNKSIDAFTYKLDGESRVSIPIDENNSYIIGKHGPVIKCKEEKDGKEVVVFKNVKSDIDISRLKNGGYLLEEIVSANSDIVLGYYEDELVLLKTGKYGFYCNWKNKNIPLKDTKDRMMDSITLDEVIKNITIETKIQREISDTLSIRKSDRGDYIYFKTTIMKKPKFLDIKDFAEDYINCELNILKSWIKNKYNVY